MDTLDYKEPITKIYLVRHGETKANVYHLLFGHLDWDLTKNGIQQAKKAGAGLTSAQSYDYIISSPLKRAKHTATIIRKELVRVGLAPTSRIVTDKNLMEKSEGKWEGKSFWDVRKEDPKNYKKWLKDPFKNKPPKGESVADLDRRVKKFHKTVLKKYSGKNIIVASHSGPIRLFILNILKANIDKFWHLKIECGSITEVHVSKKLGMVCGVNEF